jgi:hypothetical protein
MRRIITTLLCLCALLTLWTPLRAVTPLVPLDSLRVSLLTVEAGPEVYERFGHSAIRIQGLPTRGDGLPVIVGYDNNVELELPYSNLPRQTGDLVFHYGVFNFNAPHFVYRFVKGETDYSIGCLPYNLMLQDYEARGLRVTEQELALSPEQAQELLFRLLINYLPYNRKYRYNFFFDNCATRPFNMIDEASGSLIIYSIGSHRDTTLRDMLREKTGRNTWLDFGISLVIAGRADAPTSFDDRMFLPEYLMEAYDSALIMDDTDTDPSDARKLVSDTRIVVDGNPLLRARLEEPQNPITSPIAFGWVVLIFAVLMSTDGYRHRTMLRTLDTALLVASGLTGVMVWFLNFFSMHPAVDHNWNCLWLVPFNLLFAVLIWIKRCKRVVQLYFFITFVAIIVYLVSRFFTAQFMHPAFFPLVLALELRYGVYCGFIKIEHRRRRLRDQEINI